MSEGRVSLTACVLAGGKSTRMGQDKAGVLYRDQPLLQHQLATLKQIAPDHMLISGRSDACHAQAGVPVILDETPDAGPLGGVAALLQAASTPLVLIVAVDMPLLTADFLRMLWGQSTETCGRVVRNSGHFEAVAAVYPKVALGIARTMLADADRSMQMFVRQCMQAGLVSIADATVDEAALFKSMNRPQDLLVG